MDRKGKSVIKEGGRVPEVSDSQLRRNHTGYFDLKEKERDKNKERK